MLGLILGVKAWLFFFLMKGLIQAFSMCMDNNLSNNEWILYSYIYLQRDVIPLKEGWIWFVGFWHEPSKNKWPLNARNKFLFLFCFVCLFVCLFVCFFFLLFLDNYLINRACISLKLYYKFYIPKGRFWLLEISTSPFRNNWPKNDCFNSGQILILYQISTHNQISKLYHVWMVCPYLPQLFCDHI